MLFPDRLRSQYFFCAMSLMALGAHRGRPVAAAPCTPGLRPATSPLRGAFDLSLQASGRAEAASLQNTALSPHPCGLPRPSGNVSAMLRPPAPAVSAAPAPAVIWGCRPGKAQPPPGINAAPCLMPSPGGAALSRATIQGYFRADCAPDMSSALCHLWRLERTGGGQSPPPPVPPGSGQQHRRCAVPSTYPCRLRVGPRQRPCKTRPSARIHAGCPGLPGTSQRC